MRYVVVVQVKIGGNVRRGYILSAGCKLTLRADYRQRKAGQVVTPPPPELTFLLTRMLKGSILRCIVV